MDIGAARLAFVLFFRRSRMRRFVGTFDVTDQTRIIDIGGTPFNWSLIEQQPQITMVNIEGGPGTQASLEDHRQQMVFYDGCVVQFPNRSFDICYSNSVIEHVGGREAVQRFAAEVRRLAPRYFVQTPNRRFFVEPHFICVFIHWLPTSLMRRLIRWTSIWGWLTRPDQATIDRIIAETRLLTVNEMRTLFPDAKIISERFLGLTKSIIAIKR